MTDETQGIAPAAAAEPTPVDVKADAEIKPEAGAEPAPAVAKPDVAPEDKLQRRFDKLTREKYDALRDRDRANYELEKLRETQAKTPPVAQEPTLESSGFDEAKYRQSLREFSIAEARAEAKRVLDEERQRSVAEEQETLFDKRQRDFIASKPDYTERVLENPDLPISKSMAKVIRELDTGPQIAYYLSEHEDEARAIQALPELSQAVELGRIKAQLEAKKAPPKPPVSQAPPPPAKLDAADPGTEKSPEDMIGATPASFAKWRRKYMTPKR